MTFLQAAIYLFIVWLIWWCVTSLLTPPRPIYILFTVLAVIFTCYVLLTFAGLAVGGP